MWFIEIFTDLDSRARIFAILLSAALGFTGVAYTQSRTKGRENKAHRRSKYEEIVTELINLKKKRFIINTHLLKPEEERKNEEATYDQALDEVKNISAKLDMLFSIYAPSVMPPKETILELALKGHYLGRQLLEDRDLFTSDDLARSLEETDDLTLSADTDLKALQETIITTARQLT